MKGMYGYFAKELMKLRDMHASLARRYEDAISAQKIGIRPLYRVEIVSLWAAEGESGVTVENGTALKQAIVDAVREFKVVNNRGDVQGRYSVYAIFAGNISIPVPEKYWKKYLPAK
jgi:hypothetical protein